AAAGVTIDCFRHPADRSGPLRSRPRAGDSFRPVRKETRESQVEARWPALIAVLTLGGLYLALPSNLVFGPPWLYPVVVAGLVVPTVLLHRKGRHDLDRVLGYILSGV